MPMKLYPLADPLTPDETKLVAPDSKVLAQATGEIRPPRKGEWYLSGAVIEAYRAPNDLPSSFPIARLIEETAWITD